MCLLVLLHRVVEEAPLIVAANREEAHARPGEPPQLLLTGPYGAVGGRDPRAGGSWLAVNAHGLLVAVTNRPKGALPARPRSRGLLVCDLLACLTAAEAAAQARRALASGCYAGCNVVCADAAQLYVVHGGDDLRWQMLPPGLHLLTNRDVNDTSDPRLLHARRELQRHGSWGSVASCVEVLKTLCRQTANRGPAMCLHGETHGTVSSSILALRQPLNRGLYMHAQGPPDRTPYDDYSHLLEELAKP